MLYIAVKQITKFVSQSSFALLALGVLPCHGLQIHHPNARMCERTSLLQIVIKMRVKLFVTVQHGHLLQAHDVLLVLDSYIVSIVAIYWSITGQPIGGKTQIALFALPEKTSNPLLTTELQLSNSQEYNFTLTLPISHQPL